MTDVSEHARAAAPASPRSWSTQSRPTAARAFWRPPHGSGTGPPCLTTEQVAQVLRLLRGADSAELRLSVADADRQSAVVALGIDVVGAQAHHVAFFDTPGLDLDRHGIAVRARRIHGSPGDSVVTLRSLGPERIPPEVRRSRAVHVEIDAVPGGYVCSGTMTAQHDDATLTDAFAGRRPLHTLFTAEQRAFFAAHAPDSVELEDLSILGPIDVSSLRSAPDDHGRRLISELWTYPDGSRVLELSTRCEPLEAVEVAAATRTYLATRGIDLAAEQQTTTRRALDVFANELRGGAS